MSQDEDKRETRDNRLLQMIQKKYPDFHPILVLADIASDNGLRSTDPGVVSNAAKAIMPYLEPQLKAIEVRGNVRADFGVLRVSMEEPSAGEGEKID